MKVSLEPLMENMFMVNINLLKASIKRMLFVIHNNKKYVKTK